MKTLISAFLITTLSTLLLIAGSTTTYAYSNGLEDGSKIELTRVDPTIADSYRVWAVDGGDIVSRYDTPTDEGGGRWENHGHGGSPATVHGVSTTSYVLNGANYEHVFYAGVDGNLYMGVSVDGGPVTWSAWAPPGGTSLVGHMAATSFLYAGDRYLIVAARASGLKLLRWVRPATGGAATWADTGVFDWTAQYGISVTKNASESIVSFFTTHTLATGSLGMLRWNNGYSVVDLGRPCGPNFAIQGRFSPLQNTYRLSVACTSAPATVHIASATSESSTSFTWTSHTMPAAIMQVANNISGATRVQNAGSIVHEFYVLLSNKSLARIGIGSTSTTVSDYGQAIDIDAFAGGMAVGSRYLASRVFYLGKASNATRLYERRGEPDNSPHNYRFLGSQAISQWWPAPNQAAEMKVAAWKGTQAMSVMNRPGIGGPSDWPSVWLSYTDNQNHVYDPGKAKQITNSVPIPGVGDVVHNFVGDPTVVMTDDKVAYSLQVGQVMNNCASGETISRSSIYLVSTNDGVTHSSPILIATQTGVGPDPKIDHPWADIEHIENGPDIIHIVWWDYHLNQIKYASYTQNVGLGPVRILRNGNAFPPRVTASDSHRTVVYFGDSGGTIHICELNASRSGCTTPPGSIGGWTPVGDYYYGHQLEVSLGTYMRSYYGVSMALSEANPAHLHYCAEVRESVGNTSDIRCGRLDRSPIDGSWSLATSTIVNSVPDDGKDQFTPEVAVTTESGPPDLTSGVLATWYDRSGSATNYTYQVMRSVSTDGGITFAPPIADNMPPSDPEYLPRHCLRYGLRFHGDYAAVEGDVLHKNMPAVFVAGGASSQTHVISFVMSLASWGSL